MFGIFLSNLQLFVKVLRAQDTTAINFSKTFSRTTQINFFKLSKRELQVLF